MKVNLKMIRKMDMALRNIMMGQYIKVILRMIRRKEWEY
jgi:hypothetical protein